MKTRTQYSLLALLVTLIITGACSSSSDDSYVYTSDCAIKSFTLGKMKRTVHTTSYTGGDSTYTITFNGSLYALTIDQVNRRIFNTEAFPLETELKTVATITGDGTIVYAAEADTSQWTLYSSSDSIDFSAPLLFRCYAYDGSGYREYRMTLNVRTNNALEYTWQPLSGIPAMTGRTEARMLMQGGEAVVLSSTATGTVFCARSTATDSPAWTEQECTGLPIAADVRSAVCYHGKLWMNTSWGKLACSSDGVNWTEVAQEDEAVGVHLVAASETLLHAAIHDTRVSTPYYMASSTDGVTWTPIPVEQMLFELPSAAVAYTQDNGNRRVLLCADVVDGDAAAPLFQWSLLEGADEPWILMTDENASNDYLPRWRNPVLLAYNDWLYALGDHDWSGQHTALDAIYVSYDNGLNWYADEDLTIPEIPVGTTAPITATVVGEYIWLMAGDQLWRVRYNDYGL
ncbi:MAG: hypothetical protein IJT75_09490 [Bacteroidaceae bacterium]|nr:hypothetical protein [Bacteroidaceae bacterium]